MHFCIWFSYKLSRLFASFIERSLDDIDYTIGDKLFLEKVFDMEIREPPPGKGIMYFDLLIIMLYSICLLIKLLL